VSPVIRPLPSNRFELVEPYLVDERWMVPAGYKTNGANIPRVFWVLIPPFWPKYLPAVIAHDYLCDLELYKEADDLFERLLFGIERSWKTKAMVYAVRLYHRLRYGVK